MHCHLTWSECGWLVGVPYMCACVPFPPIRAPCRPPVLTMVPRSVRVPLPQDAEKYYIQGGAPQEAVHMYTAAGLWDKVLP